MRIRYAGALAVATTTALALACRPGGGELDASVTSQCTPGQPSRVILFVDYSASTRHVTLPPDVRDSLGGLAGRYMRCPGDQVQAFVVHGRTRGMALRASWSNGLEPPPTREGKSYNEYRADSLRYVAQSRRFFRNTAIGILAFISGIDSTRVAAAHTDLLGSFEVASETFGHGPGGGKRVIIYVSDMFESMTGPGRRDFDVRPPTNLQEAERWATIDSALLRDMRVRTERFSNVTVQVYARPWGDREGSEFVRAYWYKMFSQVGISENRARFN